MAFLSKDMITSAEDMKTVEYDVPEWGGTALLRVMSGADLDKFELILQDPEKQKDGGVRARLVGSCLVDEKGKRLFSDAEVYQLGKKNGAVLTRVFRKCIEINKIDEAEVEEAAEDFDATHDEPSTTD